MATTEMDYENANGDRFEGQSISSTLRLDKWLQSLQSPNNQRGNAKY